MKHKYPSSSLPGDRQSLGSSPSELLTKRKFRTGSILRRLHTVTDGNSFNDSAFNTVWTGRSKYVSSSVMACSKNKPVAHKKSSNQTVFDNVDSFDKIFGKPCTVVCSENSWRFNFELEMDFIVLVHKPNATHTRRLCFGLFPFLSTPSQRYCLLKSIAGESTPA